MKTQGQIAVEVSDWSLVDLNDLNQWQKEHWSHVDQNRTVEEFAAELLTRAVLAGQAERRALDSSAELADEIQATLKAQN